MNSTEVNIVQKNGEIVAAAWKYGWPVMVTIGLLGNLLSIIIFGRRNTQNPVTQKLIILAVTDLVIVLVFFTSNWLLYVHKLSLFNLHNISCKVMMWSVETMLEFSSLSMSDITLDRLYSVLKPLDTWTSKKKLRGATKLFCLLLALMILNSHYFYGFEAVHVKTNNVTANAEMWCTITSLQYSHFYAYFGMWLDMAFIFYLPYVIIIISNVLIFAKLKGFFNKDDSLDPQKSSSGRSLQAASNMRIILALNIVFILTTCPRSVLLIYFYLVDRNNTEELNRVILAGDIAHVIMYGNNCINFFFYLASSTQFRQEFKALFIKSRKKPPKVSAINMEKTGQA